MTLKKYRVTAKQEMVTDYIVEAATESDAVEAYDSCDYEIEHRIDGDESIIHVLELFNLRSVTNDDH